MTLTPARRLEWEMQVEAELKVRGDLKRSNDARIDELKRIRDAMFGRGSDG